MNRRDFLKGLGALLATTAIVKPAHFAWIDACDTEIMAAADGYSYVTISPWQKCFYEQLVAYRWSLPDDYVAPFKGEIGQYLGIKFAERE